MALKSFPTNREILWDLKVSSGNERSRWTYKPPREPGDPIGLTSLPGDLEIRWDLKSSPGTGR